MAVKEIVPCPECGASIEVFRNPIPTVDIIILIPGEGVVLIERKNEPFGWAIPGGFVDYGETLEAAAEREAREETGLEVEELQQFHAYSDPDRDPRHHTITVVFSALGKGTPRAADDAKSLKVFPLDQLPESMAFDHCKILSDYFDVSL